MRWIVIALAISCGTCSINAGTEKIQNETDASLQAKIVRGTTTKEEVREALGAPSGSSITASGNEQWLYYRYQQSTNPFSQAQAMNKTIPVIFDKLGEFICFSMSDSGAH
jgi:outer membrane protein assembly factor BamE (lipoprotein component of BamABCDE complex)